MSNKEYKVKVHLYGFPAYVIDELRKLGLHGSTREGVVERIVANYIEEHLNDRIPAMGLSIEDAIRKGYIPIKVK